MKNFFGVCLVLSIIMMPSCFGAVGGSVVKLDKSEIEKPQLEYHSSTTKANNSLLINSSEDLSKIIDDSIALLPVSADVKADVEEFFVQRLIIFLNSDYAKNVLEACSSKNPCKDLCDYVLRVKAISTLNNDKLLENANRVLRILKDGASDKIDTGLFVEKAEKDLYNAIQGVNFAGDYNKYLNDLISINSVVTKFFDDVLVMDKDENIKNNRLALLNSLKNKYVLLTDFSKL